MRGALVLLMGLVCAGCAFPSERLSFPQPLTADAAGRSYDVDRDGRIDFAIRAGEGGRMTVLEYDDDQDGTPDRVYRLGDYPPEQTPHLIILFDSIPFAPVVERWRDAHWSWFDEPMKVIPPFPTMSPVIFSRLFGAPPLGGVINHYYDRLAGGRADRLSARVSGHGNPWESRLHYRLKYWENGLSFLHPRRWFRADLARAKRAFDRSPDRVTIVYFASTAGLVGAHGAEGVRECLDGLEQLCVQLLYERRGAVQISAMADHGHNLRPGRRIDLEEMLKEAGFRPRGRLRLDNEVVVEQDGLVNYAGIHTRKAADVAAALAARPEIELAIYHRTEQVIVRDAGGSAVIEHHDGRYRYRPVEKDVLGLSPVADQLRAEGKSDADGFATEDDWFDTTLGHQWPNAPPRLWGAFHGLVINTPDVMVTTCPGYYVGLASFDWFVDMASTHGGLDQADSATFLLTTTGRARRALRSEQVFRTIEPSYNPTTFRRKP